MINDIKKVVQDIKSNDNPLIIANKLSWFLTDSLRNESVNIYEAYLINSEIIDCTRDGYILPAWNGSVRITTLLTLLNQRLLAIAFKDYDYAGLLKKWGVEAFSMCREKRTHYICDRYLQFLEAEEKTFLLQELLDVRMKYNSLKHNDGPYHTESFPYDYCEPEKILLEKKDLEDKKSVSCDIGTLLIELKI